MAELDTPTGASVTHRRRRGPRRRPGRSSPPSPGCAGGSLVNSFRRKGGAGEMIGTVLLSALMFLGVVSRLWLARA